MKNPVEQPSQIPAIERFLASPSLKETTGIAIVLLNRNGQLAVVEELKTKPGLTLPGQYSIPIETRKHDESRRDAMLGAFAEIVDDDVLEEVGRDAFQWPPQAPAIYRPGIRKGNVPLQGELHVVRFMGDPDYQLRPTATDEVSFAGWQKPRELYGLKHSGRLRPAAVMPLARVITDGIIAVTEENDHTVELFTPDFSMSQFYKERESKPDMV